MKQRIPVQTRTQKRLQPTKWFPIPKGDSYYSEAKRAEYIDKNWERAEILYTKEIELGDRKASAVKDLAVLMHQQGKTTEGCELLKKHAVLFKQDIKKYENLLNRLSSQIMPSKKCLHKNLKISNLNKFHDEKAIRDLFHNPERIQSVKIAEAYGMRYAILQFLSHSSARKTLETLKDQGILKVEYLTVGEQPTPKQTTLFPCKLFLNGLEALDAHYDTMEGSVVQTDEYSRLLGKQLWGEVDGGLLPCKELNFKAPSYNPTYLWQLTCSQTFSLQQKMEEEEDNESGEENELPSVSQSMISSGSVGKLRPIKNKKQQSLINNTSSYDNSEQNPQTRLNKLQKQNRNLRQALIQLNEKLNKYISDSTPKQKASTQKSFSGQSATDTYSKRAERYQRERDRVAQRYEQITDPDYKNNMIEKIRELNADVGKLEAQNRDFRMQQKGRSKKLTNVLDSGESLDMYNQYNEKMNEHQYYATRIPKLEKRIEQLENFGNNTKEQKNSKKEKMKDLHSKSADNLEAANKKEIVQEYSQTQMALKARTSAAQSKIARLKVAVLSKEKNLKSLTMEENSVNSRLSLVESQISNRQSEIAELQQKINENVSKS